MFFYNTSRCLFVCSKFYRGFYSENKGVQVSSAGNRQPTEEPKNKIYILSEKPGGSSPVRLARKTKTKILPAKKNSSAAESLLLEDVEGNEYRILDKRQSSWSEETADTRQEMFFKQGNAEILRIMSNDSLEVMDSASNVGAINVYDEAAGKKVIMNKFLNSQTDQSVAEDSNSCYRPDPVTRETAQPEEKKKNDLEEEQKKMAAFQRDVLLTR